MKLNLTAQDKKNLKDRLWRLENLYYIKTKDGKKIKFKLNYAQSHFLKNYTGRDIILKSRQLGFSTLEEVLKLDSALFKPNTDCLIIAQGVDEAEDLFDNKVRFAWDNLTEEFRSLFTVDSDSSKTLKFDFGDGSKSSIRVRTSGRSGTYHHLHISEFAKICLKYPARAKEIIEGTFPAVPINGTITIESTAEGQQGQFYDMFWEAWGRKKEHTTQFTAHFYNWTWDKDEIAKVVKTIPDLPKEFTDIQEMHKLTDQEISYYYLKWLSLNKNWDSLRQEYPTTPEEAFETSVEGAYYHTQLQQAKQDKRVCKLAYNPYLDTETYWDLGGVKNKASDEMVIGVVQRYGKEIRIIDCIHGAGLPYKHYWQLLKDKGYKRFTRHVLPWDARIGSASTGETVEDLFYENASLYPELNLNNVEIAPNTQVIVGINKVRDLFSQFYFNQVETTDLVKALMSYRKEWNDKTGRWNESPVHDYSSHFADMIRYLAVMYEEDSKQFKKTKPRYNVNISVDPITGF